MIEKILKRYPAGSDITLLNCFYQFKQRDPETGAYSDDFIVLLIKDNSTGKKEHFIINKPKYKFYTVKPGNEASYNKMFIEIDKLDEHEVEYNKLEKTIATVLGREADYNDAISLGDRESIRKLHADPRVFNSDQSIEDKYRHEFSKYYPNNVMKLNKAFFDIEVDGRYISTEFPEPELAEAPINAVSLFDERSNRVITFLLEDYHNPLIAKFKSDYESGVFTEQDIHNFVQDTVGGYKKMVRNKLEYTSFELKFYDNELELLIDLFGMIRKLDPDFIEGWNSSAFDCNYIIHRITNLGADPAVVLSDPTWDKPYLKLYIDQRNINDFAERGDYMNVCCNTVYLDQMIQFCSRRKAKMGSFTSFKLDDIGQLMAGVKKLDYSHITTNLTELPYLDYKTFVLYNIMDTVVQKCIENKSQDIEYIFAKCIVNATSYKKGHRQTVYLINRMTKEWFKLGYVIGNNVNKWNEKPPKFAGALVGDPLKTSDYAKIKVDGNPILVCDNLQDYDFKSLYPSVILEFNIAPNTQIGRINIWNPTKGVYSHKDYPVKDDKTGEIKMRRCSRVLPEGVYYLRSDTEDNNFIDVYKDYKYKEYLGRLYLDGPNATRQPFIKEEWKIQEVKIYDQENAFNTDHYMRAGEFVENLVSDNIIEFAKRWLNLAGFEKLSLDMQEYFNKFFTSYSINGWYGHTHYYPETNELLECPIVDMGNKKADTPIKFSIEPERPFNLYGTIKSNNIDISKITERKNG